jgi:hypothetical protein
MGRRVDRSGFETMYSAFVCVRVPRGWTSSGNGCFASKTPTAGGAPRGKDGSRLLQGPKVRLRANRSARFQLLGDGG